MLNFSAGFVLHATLDLGSNFWRAVVTRRMRDFGFVHVPLDCMRCEILVDVPPEGQNMIEAQTLGQCFLSSRGEGVFSLATPQRSLQGSGRTQRVVMNITNLQQLLLSSG